MTDHGYDPSEPDMLGDLARIFYAIGGNAVNYNHFSRQKPAPEGGAREFE
ncbi:MAG: hypothetical protein ACFCU6_01650 [Balneolaceae bacterium]